MLDPRSWLDQAKTLDIGRSMRVDHDCGSGRTLKVDHKEHGWGAWCWRCNDDGWVAHPEESLAQRLARLTAVKAVEAEASRSVALPTPAEYDAALWPKEARLWLYKIGMSNDNIRKAGFYYNDRLSRVVLPVYNRNHVVYWQARNLTPKDGRPSISTRWLINRRSSRVMARARRLSSLRTYSQRGRSEDAQRRGRYLVRRYLNLNVLALCNMVCLSLYGWTPTAPDRGLPQRFSNN